MELTTRIIVRNDSTVNWSSNDDQVLLKGEMGIEFTESGEPKIKIGDGVKTWSELSYFGGTSDHIFEVELAEGQSHMEAIAAAVGETKVAVGDIAFVKELIVDGKYQHTAYVHNGTDWAAMDGNYTADNVFFTEDMTVTTTVGTITELTNGSAIFQTAGKSLTQVLNSLLAEEKDPTADAPSVSISASGGSGEVGSSYTLPTATLTIDDVGSYTYGPATGIVFEAGKVVLSEGSDNSKSNEAQMVAGNTMTLKATDDETLYTDTAKSYTFSATAEHTQGAMPVTNLGNDFADAQIAAGSVTVEDKKVSFTGYRKMFMGTISDNSTAIDSATIRGLSLVSKQVGKTAQTFTVPVGATKIIVAFPKSYTTKAPKFEYFTMSWEDFAGFTAMESAVSVADYRGTNEDGTLNGAMDYTVYTFTHASPSGFEADTQFRVTLK